MDTPRYIPPADSIAPVPTRSTAPKPLLKGDKKIPPRHRAVSEENKSQRARHRAEGYDATAKLWKQMAGRMRTELEFRYQPITVFPFKQIQW